MNSVKKITLFLILLGVVLGCILAAGCTDSSASSTTSSDPVLTISVQKEGGFEYNIGDKFSITLPSNPSTGYSWKVTSVAEGLKYEEVEVPVEDNGLVGAPTSQKFIFSATKEGTLPFEISYVKAGENAGIYIYSDVLRVSKDAPSNSGSFVYDGTYIPFIGEKVQLKLLDVLASDNSEWKLELDEGLTVLSKEFIGAERNGEGLGVYVWTLTATQPGVYDIVAEKVKSGTEEVTGGFFLPLTFQLNL